MWIRLKNIQVYAFHGAFAHEREHGARFEMDVEIEAPLEDAATRDDLASTIDYVAVQKTVIHLATENKYRLLESLAQSIAKELMERYTIHKAIVRVRKPGASIGGILESVEVECCIEK